MYSVYNKKTKEGEIHTTIEAAAKTVGRSAKTITRWLKDGAGHEDKSWIVFASRISKNFNRVTIGRRIGEKNLIYKRD